MNARESITVWIVEDVAKDALDAAAVVREVAEEANFDVNLYWDSTLVWDSLLSGPPPGEYRPGFHKADCPPTVVILDLFAPAGFLAKEFLLKLREFEDNACRKRSFVILWSVYTGFEDAQDLIYKEPKRDRKVIFSKSKQPPVLRETLARCLTKWKEQASYL